MALIRDILQPEMVNLALAATDKAEAIAEVLSKLNGHPSVGDFPALQQAVLARNAAAIGENGVGICIAHGRTEAVHTLVITAGRSLAGFSCPDVPDPIRLVFVAGIPGAFNAEYLRIVGVIARICRDRAQFDRLLAAKTPQRFVEILGAAEQKL